MGSLTASYHRAHPRRNGLGFAKRFYRHNWAPSWPNSPRKTTGGATSLENAENDNFCSLAWTCTPVRHFSIWASPSYTTRI